MSLIILQISQNPLNNSPRYQALFSKDPPLFISITLTPNFSHSLNGAILIILTATIFIHPLYIQPPPPPFAKTNSFSSKIITFIILLITTPYHHQNLTNLVYLTFQDHLNPSQNFS